MHMLVGNGEVESCTTAEVTCRVKLHARLNELSSLAAEWGSGGGRAEVGEDGRLGGRGRCGGGGWPLLWLLLALRRP